jgi:hypothetical protein
MNTLINTALNPTITSLRRSGLLAEDLDYHIVRASMVIMFFFFGYRSGGPTRRSVSFHSSATVR